jgi:hypothetical protein
MTDATPDSAASIDPRSAAAGSWIARPFQVLGIVGFGLSFFGPIGLVGLVLSVVALIGGRRHGYLNVFALVGLIVSVLGLLILGVILALALPPIIDAVQTCAELGDGVHVVGNATYTCAPGSSSVHSGF